MIFSLIACDAMSLCNTVMSSTVFSSIVSELRVGEVIFPFLFDRASECRMTNPCTCEHGKKYLCIKLSCENSRQLNEIRNCEWLLLTRMHNTNTRKDIFLLFRPGMVHGAPTRGLTCSRKCHSQRRLRMSTLCR